MFILLLLLWIILNGKINVEILCIGILVVSAVSYFMYKNLGYSSSNDGKLMRKIAWGLWFLGIVVIEVVKSGLAVLKFVVEKDINIQPQIVVFRVPIKTDFLKMILANAITLTPGTITLHIEGDKFYVHAFDYTFGEELQGSVFITALKKIEDDLENYGKETEIHE